jgi:hypothetical protein
VASPWDFHPARLPPHKPSLNRNRLRAAGFTSFIIDDAEFGDDEDIVITNALGLKPEHLAALGRITVNYSFVEMLLRSLLRLLCEPDGEIARTLTSGETFGKLLEHAAAVCRIRAAQGMKVVDEFEPLRVRIETAARKRNDVVHALWEVGDTLGIITPHRIPRRARGDGLEKGTPLSSVDLDGISEELLGVADALAAFSGALCSQGRAPTSQHVSPSGRMQVLAEASAARNIFASLRIFFIPALADGKSVSRNTTAESVRVGLLSSARYKRCRTSN